MRYPLPWRRAEAAWLHPFPTLSSASAPPRPPWRPPTEARRKPSMATSLPLPLLSRSVSTPFPTPATSLLRSPRAPRARSAFFLVRRPPSSLRTNLAAGGDGGLSAEETPTLAEDGSEQEVSAQAEKRPPMTARERLRASRAVGRLAGAKPAAVGKGEFGSGVLAALKESDKGSTGRGRSGLPQAPTDLFDDGKRGMPKEGWTFELPVGADIVAIVVSFVVISIIMFGTTYLVWKVGAIHYNDY